MQAEQVDVLVSDLARVHSGEVTLVQECGDLLCRAHLSQVKFISLYFNNQILPPSLNNKPRFYFDPSLK